MPKVRKEFQDQYRGTVSEGCQNLVHWILCLLFMLETIVAADFITSIRSKAFREPEGSTFGISNVTVVLLAKYAVTLNIKLVDFIWTPLSTWLSQKENWRTETDLKAQMVVKLFAVKFVVFYYPFAFTIFVQPYEAEGCDGGHMSGGISLKKWVVLLYVVVLCCPFHSWVCLPILGSPSVLKCSKHLNSLDATRSLPKAGTVARASLI